MRHSGGVAVCFGQVPQVGSANTSFTSEDYTPEHADVFAARYDDGLRAIKVARVLRFLGDLRDRDVLDLGCGIGYFATLCADSGARAVACDFAESMVERTVKRYAQRFPVVRASAEQPPFRPGTFDIVLALDVVEHLYFASDMLRRVHEVLRPSGRLILTTDRLGFQLAGIPAYPLRIFRLLLRRRASEGLAGRPRSKYQTPRCTHVREYRVRELIRLAEDAGLLLTALDTFPNRADLGIWGHVVESIGKGGLRKYKFDHAIYEFTKPGVE